jgi:hypothetical protein
MEGKLKKIGNEYKLYAQDDSCIATTHESPYKKLSLKNCEAIANGYDLDDLSRERLSTRFDENSGYHKFVFVEAYKEGFLKAMEILGDKKFSEDDMLSFESFVSKWYDKAKDIEEFTALPSELLVKWKSLQQTEWDVWIVMSCGLPDGCTEPGKECSCDIIPALDKDGFLILTSAIWK